MRKLKWKPPLDPVELKDYVVDWTDEMAASSDTLISSVFILPPEAIADGLVIADQSHTTMKAKVWFHVPNSADRDPMLGKSYEIENNVSTVGGRDLNVSARLSVMDK